jgi:hypothetical protein
VQKYGGDGYALPRRRRGNWAVECLPRLKIQAKFRERVRGKYPLTVNFKSLNGLSVEYPIL